MLLCKGVRRSCPLLAHRSIAGTLQNALLALRKGRRRRRDCGDLRWITSMCSAPLWFPQAAGQEEQEEQSGGQQALDHLPIGRLAA
eukprot:760272-Hanusia_phi.AAC.4